MTSTILVILASLCILLSLVLLAMDRRLLILPVMPAYVAMWLCSVAGVVYLPMRFLLIWGGITLLIVALDWFQPEMPRLRLSQKLYLLLGAVAGSLLAFALSPHYIILACAFGAALGMLAYARTPDGKETLSASSSLLLFYAMYALPIVALVSMLMLLADAAVVKHIAESYLNF